MWKEEHHFTILQDYLEFSMYATEYETEVSPK